MVVWLCRYVSHHSLTFQYSGSEWIIVGKLSATESKTRYNGQHYDFVFDVEVEDGRLLKLPYNISGTASFFTETVDNIYDVSSRFVLQNNLPEDFQKQIVQFLFSQTSGRCESKPRNMTPPLDLQVVDSFNIDGIKKRLTEFNQLEAYKVLDAVKSHYLDSRQST